MTQDRKPPNPARRNQRSRQAILSATADLLGEVGYTKLTVEAVAPPARAAQQAGQLRKVDLDVAAELLYGPVYYRWLLRTGPISREYVDALVAMTLRALT